MKEQLAIQCREIKKSYGSYENRVDALRGINLDIYQGQLTLIVGPSGSGKSTLVSIMTTLLTPDEGSLLLLGKEAKYMTENEKAQFRRDKLGIVFQSLFLIPTLTVLENVTLPLVVAGYEPQRAANKGKAILERMHLADRLHIPPTMLSKGQQQKVAIARAIINEAKIIVCDEPTSALDQASGMVVMKLLRELAADGSRAIIVVTHDNRIFSAANSIVTMSDGLITTGKEHE